MVFSSILFIFYFLPITLLLYFVCPVKYRNYILLIASLIFYFIGEPINIVYLFLSCIINYTSSILMERIKKYKKIILTLTISYNVIQLFIFKYTDFFITNINSIINTNLKLTYIIMPIGISFYTFQAISYIIDVYNNKHKKAKNLFEFMTYLCLFPQLIAGPIVRYTDIKNEMNNRKINIDDFSNGIKRFIIGLSKKVLLANVIGELITKFTIETVVSSWIKAISYTLQIYFDFSGYSDMAIGLGLMFGFHFLENFNYPLIASSITDFWRRWHISLSSWFKDYIYIPLGGNRVSKIKWYRNIFIVWFLTGFWHGASWNFILWGLYFAIILVIEKIFLLKKLNKTKIIKHIYTILIIIISFLIFSLDSIDEVFIFLKNMLFINNIELINKETLFYLKDYLGVIIIAIISSTPIVKEIYNKVKKNKITDLIEITIYTLLLILSVSFIIDASFNPFLYFRF